VVPLFVGHQGNSVGAVMGRSGGFQHFVLSARNEGAIKVAELEENEKKALLAAGVVLGIVGTFAALVKAAMDQAAQSDGS
jgi:hypothetical protein